MADFNFITVRLGKDSIRDIQQLTSSAVGIISKPFNITVKCTQIPDNYGSGDYAFIWLGSDNNKGAPTEWKQGFKAVGRVVDVERGNKRNDESLTTLQIVYVFRDSINRLDILRNNPVAYYWCSGMPLIGIDDHANQTIRTISAENRSDIAAFFVSLESSTGYFKDEILKVEPMFRRYFDVQMPSPKEYPNATSIQDALLHKRHPSNNNNRNLLYLTSIRTKPFMLLAGISGTGKSRIVRKLAQATVTEDLQRKYDNKYNGGDFSQDRWELHSPANFCLIQVKPNWHNSMDVVGYLSNVPKPHYVFTAFVNFIIRAWQNPDIPFFLCLDEMNLAPVEEYFAEFLSAIESRSKDKGIYETDPIIKPFNEFGNEVCVRMVDELNSTLGFELGNPLEEQFRKKGLTLPENLIVIGTVNMDETTFSFSRKVLDRAMSVEMNDVDYDSFLQDATDDRLKEIVGQMTTERLDELLVNRHVKASEVVKQLGSDAETAIAYLKQINTLLDGTQFKLGYRAANEAMIYIQSARDFKVNSLEETLDNFTLMKILSRLEGDTTKLKLTVEDNSKQLKDAKINIEEASKYGELSILTALRYIIESNLGGTTTVTDSLKTEDTTESADNNGSNDNSANKSISETKQMEFKLNSIKKLDSMIHQLARDHFVSFWN